MSLRKDLKSHLEHLLQETLRRETEIRTDLDSLENFNAGNAEYLVLLNSAWADHGEQSTRTEHKGNLKDTVKKAEEEFKKVNKRSDVQAYWNIYVKLGQREHEIPEKYWSKYKTSLTDSAVHDILINKLNSEPRV